MLKLYRVQLKGMRKVGSEPNYQESYVVANDAEQAYQSIRTYLKEKYDRASVDIALDSIKLIAEAGEYPGCQTVLFLNQDYKEKVKELHKLIKEVGSE